MGFQNAFITAAFAGLVQALTFLIFVKWAKKMRKASVHPYYRYVKEMAEAGLTHWNSAENFYVTMLGPLGQ